MSLGLKPEPKVGLCLSWLIPRKEQAQKYYFSAQDQVDETKRNMFKELGSHQSQALDLYRVLEICTESSRFVQSLELDLS